MKIIGTIFGIAFGIAYLATIAVVLTLLVKCDKEPYFDEDEENI